MNSYAAIDFGTSNSAVYVGAGAQGSLTPLERDRDTMPTAVFFNADERTIVFGRQAIAEYQAGFGGRLMRSLKSLLGSELIDETTLVNGKTLAYRSIIGHYVSHLKAVAEANSGRPLDRVVLGRPVHFVDDDGARDAQAQVTLEQIARDAGFGEVQFLFEPIAAALDFESRLSRETLVLVVDIGGGTSDFSLIRLGPERRRRLDRSGDVLANAGVHIAGTDFDQQLSLAAVMPQLGMGSLGETGKPVPTQTYFELATWHRINFLYSPRALADAQTLRPFFADARLHARLMRVLREREGHRIAGLVEEAKVATAEGGAAQIDLGFIEAGLSAALGEALIRRALDKPLSCVAQTAVDAVQAAGIEPAQVDALYFTGGSTGLIPLRRSIAAAFPRSEIVLGDKFSSVASGLGLHAAKLFAGQ
ncbi:MAG TPA: Hsp70 family protein [Fontimonas sp.]